MSTKFVVFTNAHTKKPVLVNPAHVNAASEVDGHNMVRLVMDAGSHQEVEGNLKSVWETLTRTPVDLTWT
jgi:hypothetical protein